jgi:methylase of polypeptide subunit release factors
MWADVTHEATAVHDPSAALTDRSGGAPETGADPPAAAVVFGGLVLRVGPEVIVPRPWTVYQSRWAAELAARLPAGPILELCAGCGAIGLEAARRSGRRVVLVDASAAACRCAAGNVTANGMEDGAEIRHAPARDALGAGERFPLILADPPYVPSADVSRYPADPRLAIDGGADGLGPMREILRVVSGHLAEGGAALVQVRGAAQAEQVSRLAGAMAPALRTDAIRGYGIDRAVIELRAGEGRPRPGGPDPHPAPA